MKLRTLFLLILPILIATGCGSPEGESENADATTDSTISAIEKNPLNDVYWGDTHLHTNLSMDAGAFGNRIGMDEAYRFARGEEVTSTGGLKAKLSRPLDFLVIADHSDGMGLFNSIVTGGEFAMEHEEGRRWKKMIEEGDGATAAFELIEMFSQGTLPYNTNDPEFMTPVWESVVDAAEKYNDPGTFTAFIGYEWTSLMSGNNLHRVVIYRDNADKTRDFLPYTLADSPDPEDLWKYLTRYEAETGGQVLAIAHNGNLSNGMMFAESTIAGNPLDEAYAKERIRWEPLYEITQIKGDGEAHPFLSPNDEFADFETWDKGNLDLSTLKSNDMLKGEYGRSALLMGLKYQSQLGVNPYKFGFIGSTDSHTSLATADDNLFFGKASNTEPSAERAAHPFVSSELGTIMGWETIASGYAAVWAESNTREDLFDAMMRKETYATTGPRIVLRFFGGWDFTEADLNENCVQNGYDRGVPMGASLKAATGESAPSFLLHAIMDPEGGSLDRIQVVKGWLNDDGTLAEKVYDVKWSGERVADEKGNVPPVGNTVNLDDATWSNDIGSGEFKVVWTDPDFDAGLEAFYYLRVLEIPTPRWTLYDKIRFDAELDEEVPLVSQQRAYSSPIWYTPQ